MTPYEALRMHRHDVLNHLQLVKGYLQLQKPDMALLAVNRCVEWLASLSHLQTLVSQAWMEILWTALACPHLRVELDRETPSDDESGQNVLPQALLWLEEAAVVHNMEKLTVVIGAEGDGVLKGTIYVENGNTSGLTHGLFTELASAFPAVRWFCG